ncbi:MAG TPA: SDR family oxidoreductase [Hyphomonadaceae bacterium]|mgnify:FL=1|jgi:NAD(P)H dehydrogenase (quinone)|nr:SDR family oxidoreductase [Hyphomonadaceae bacterium]
MIAITGANGQLGRLVIQSLQRLAPATRIIAAVRSPDKAQDLKSPTVEIREADYDRPATLVKAFTGVDKLLLISANDLSGVRLAQHKAAIDAAKSAGVKLIAYTSILHTDTSELILTEEHRATEAYLKASGVPHVLLRNGWYTENETAALPAVLAHSAFIGSSAEGRISYAARADYAEAAARVLLADDQAGRTYELAGDEGVTLGEFAAETARLAGKPISYVNLPQADYAAALLGAGLPAPLANMLADSSAKSATGGLYDNTRTLSRLIGRPTTPIRETLAAALKAHTVAA